jgi:hypothetical protein
MMIGALNPFLRRRSRPAAIRSGVHIHDDQIEDLPGLTCATLVPFHCHCLELVVQGDLFGSRADRRRQQSASCGNWVELDPVQTSQ